MPTVTEKHSVFSGDDDALLGVCGVDLILIDGELHMVVGGAATGAMSLYSLSADTANLVDTMDDSPTSGTAYMADFQVFEDTTMGAAIIPFGRADDGATLLNLSGDGIETPQTDLFEGAPVTNAHQITVGEVVTHKGSSLIFYANSTGDGVHRLEVQENGSMVEKATFADDETLPLGDVSAIASYYQKGKAYVVAASGFDDGIAVFKVGGLGNLVFKAQIEPGDGSGFDTISAMTVVDTGALKFLVVAASGSNSLTVYEIGSGANLFETDHILDSGTTRFQNVTELVGFDLNGRAFVIAAGSDDGFTLFEVLPGGTLFSHETLIDDFDTALTNISDLDVFIAGEMITLAVASEGENGISLFEIDMSDIDAPIIGTNRHDTSLVGDGGNNVIDGKRNSDHLFGEGGDDILVDGAGKDYMTGGAGTDIFRFVDDGRRDLILDFEQNIDLIDLSQIGGIYAFSDLEITLSGNVTIIKGGGETVRIWTEDQTPIPTDYWSEDDFIFA
ncbi:MAG: hypothetical protein AAF198_05895 [Pseudomonadota bacterium]